MSVAGGEGVIILALVTVVLSAFIWWKLIHAETYEIVVIEVDTSEFYQAVRQLQAGFQEFGRIVGATVFPALQKLAEEVNRRG